MTPFQQAVADIARFQNEMELPTGWRFLLTPRKSIEQNNGLLILGLNPGGEPHQPPIESVEDGNAYLTEQWKSRLQKKFVQLMVSVAEEIGTSHEAMLDKSCTSNLVPFRSPTWESMPHPTEILAFSRMLWQKLLPVIQPGVILCIGNGQTSSFKFMVELYADNCDNFVQQDVAHGRQVVKLRKIDEVTIIGIPHLAQWSAFCDHPTLIKAVALAMGSGS